LSTVEMMGAPVCSVSFPMMVGLMVVEGCVEGVEGAIVFIAPVGKLLSIVVAAVVEIGCWGPWFWVVEGEEDILNLVNEGFFFGVIPKV
jgi:hypothetical protein